VAAEGRGRKEEERGGKRGSGVSSSNDISPQLL
jgi:hypothetical protein